MPSTARGVWQTFVRQDHAQYCAEKGLELFSCSERYAEYQNEFRNYIHRANIAIIPKYAQPPGSISLEELYTVLPLLAKLWLYYGFTEYFFHDLAYQRMLETNDPVLIKNLADLGQLKFEGREILNQFIFSDGVLPNILRTVSRMFLKEEQDAFFLYSNELLALYQDQAADYDLIAERKRCSAAGIAKDHFVTFTLPEALALRDVFTNIHMATELRGVVTCPGTARGRAVIMPMLVNKEQVRSIAQLMQVGDILVAHSTTPEVLPLCQKAAAIVTDEGGMLSHAAVVSRELKIPCIVGTKIGTQCFKNGDQLEVDAIQGIVRKI